MAKRQHDRRHDTQTASPATAPKPESRQQPARHDPARRPVQHDKPPAGGRQAAGQGPGLGDSLFVDTADLARLGRTLQGQAPLAQFVRLVGDLPRQSPGSEVTWSVKGDTDAQGRQWLRVVASAAPVLECQRCMQPFTLQVDVDSLLQVMKSEAELDAHEAHDEASGDVIERVVGSPRFDVPGLVEDELILSLPYVPKHDVCPSLPAPLQEAGSDESPPSPFAALGKLKKH